MQRKIEITEDGSHTFFVPKLNEHYHSTHGAIQESIHVFIDAGLRACEKDEVSVLEIGFGTGLNAFLTMLEAEKTRRKITYTSLELYPLSETEAKMLNYPALIDASKKEDFLRLHRAPWEHREQVSPCFSLLKLQTDFSKPADVQCGNKFNVIYFDAFAPEKQPDMWTQEIFDTLLHLSAPNAILTTYCAKGAVRRILQTAGFTVERLPGPPGKREMLRGRVVARY